MPQLQEPLHVLVVDDDPAIVRTLLLSLHALGCKSTGADSAERALHTLRGAPFDLLITDVRMDGMSGVELVHEAMAAFPDLLCVVMTAFASYENAVAAIKAGAFDYLPKPFGADQLEHVVGKISTLVHLRRENQRLRARDRGGQLDWFEGLTSPRVQHLQMLVERVAPSDATVLLTGETGSGKTALARAIHRRSSRADKPFVEVMCTAIADSLFESEVFGHVRGAFSGAVRDRAGKFEIAEGGTLFLDEIGELSPPAQAKLLRFLEDRIIERVGDNHPLRLDVRIIAATNRDIPALVRTNAFREDLYYRFNVFEFEVPPLRERREDILPLAMRLLQEAARRHHAGEVPVLSAAVMQVLMEHPWPGNVRELRNVMERVALLAAGREAALADLPPTVGGMAGLAATDLCVGGGSPEAGAGTDVETGVKPVRQTADGQHAQPAPAAQSMTLRELEERHIRQVLQLGVSMDKAAEMLGITPVTLWRKRKELGLN